MGYTITAGGRPIYDTEQRIMYAASNIKLTTGNNEIGTLTFTVPYNHSNKGYLQLRGKSSYKVAMRHSDGSRSALLFVGNVTAIDTDIMGNMTVTCKDELETLSTARFRLEDGGYQLTNANIEWLMPRIMTMFNKRSAGSAYKAGGYEFTIAECRVLSSSSSGITQEGVVLPDGTTTNPEYLFPNSRHQFEPDKIRDFLSIIKDIADSIGATIYFEYSDDLSTRSMVLDARTLDTNAHPYEYGKNLVEASVWYDTSGYYNGAYALGGIRRVRRTGTSYPYTRIPAVLDEAASVGDTSFRMHTTRSTPVVINSNYSILVQEQYGTRITEENWYDVNAESDITLGTTSADAVDVKIGGTYIQRTASSGKSVYIYAKADLDAAGCFGEEITTMNTYGTLTGYEYGALARTIIYNKAQAESHGMRLLEYNNSNIISPYLLRDRAVSEIERKMVMPRNVDARFLGIEVTHDYVETDESSHTMVGDVVHVKHEKLGIDDDFQVKGMSINVDDPTQNSYTLGAPRPSITRAIAEAEKSASDKIYDTRRQ